MKSYVYNANDNASRFEVLLSAMHLGDWHYIDNLNISGKALIINQADSEADEICDDGRVRFITCSERGLSKSRNMALRNASGEICMLCDNDVCYIDDYAEKIVSEFDRHKDADIIVFFIERPERKKPIFDREKKMNYISTMKIFSPEVAFRLASVKKAGLEFDENFGAGAEYSMGEENIFLYDALRAGLRIIYVPIKIASLLDTESTWFKGYTKKFFINRGAGYYRMTNVFYHLLIWQFALRKIRLYGSEISFFEAVRAMYKGAKEYADISGRR